MSYWKIVSNHYSQMKLSDCIGLEVRLVDNLSDYKWMANLFMVTDLGNNSSSFSTFKSWELKSQSMKESQGEAIELAKSLIAPVYGTLLDN